MNHSILNITRRPGYNQGFLYLLCAGDLFKIGVTEQTIEKRIRDLQTGNPEEIWCKCYVEIPRKHLYNVERMMHMKHHVSKVKNEWYELPSEAIASFREDCRKSLEILEMLDETEF